MIPWNLWNIYHNGALAKVEVLVFDSISKMGLNAEHVWGVDDDEVPKAFEWKHQS